MREIYTDISKVSEEFIFEVDGIKLNFYLFHI